MQLKKGAEFLKVTFLLYILLSLPGLVAVTLPVTTIYASLKSHKSLLN